MGCAQEEMKIAVQTGYWNLYRYNPSLKAAGKNPFQLDSPDPTIDLREFFKREVRFASLGRTFPAVAENLQVKAIKNAKEKHEEYKMLAEKK
jgi:pyruvate-ferredoxin/flavodoxin oxidoreductase